MAFVLYAVPFFFLLIGLELLADRWRGMRTYRLADALNSLSAGVLSQATGVLTKVVGLLTYAFAWGVDTGLLDVASERGLGLEGAVIAGPFHAAGEAFWQTLKRRGAADPSVPAYMLIGYPNVSRGPGFLGIKDGYIYLVDTETGPNGFTTPTDTDPAQKVRRQELLGALGGTAPEGSALAEYAQAQHEAFRLAGPSFMRHFDLKKEAADTRLSYGGEFGQRCLLARRLIQGGVRFVEVSHNLNFINGAGWDVHNDGIDNQHILIRELDNALAGLIEDLKRTGMLDKTLVVIATEFGRPPEFDAKGGRGHQGTAFSMILAGGGLKHCGAYGETDDLSKTVVKDPVSVPDFHATILAAMQVDTSKDLMAGGRPVPITDGGKPIARLF